jgi:predicted acylesterase/phospholipase RssA/CRP-like cAMP-binding protein
MAQGMQNISKEKVIDFLLATNFFHDIEKTLLEQLVEKFEPVSLTSGEILLKQGDIGDSLYLVVNGRLRAFKTENNKSVILGEMGRGEITGELALLTQETRAASVTAIRDSLVLRLWKSDFDEFAVQHPLQLLSIVKHSISRITHKTNESINTIATIAIVPAGNDVDCYQQFATSLAEKFAKDAPTLHLNSQRINNWLNQPDIAQTRLDDIKNNELAGWLSEQENKYRYIIYEVDPTYTPWTKRCLRQADRIVAVGDANANPKLNPTEQMIHEQQPNIERMIDLILMHRSQDLPKKTIEWIKPRTLQSHHHVVYNSNADVARIARHLSGQSVALALAGGGARGLVHIGVYKALLELGIPVDLVGGTSAGALVSCLIALNIPVEEIINTLKINFKSNKQLFDYTAPVVSLLSAKSWTRILRSAFGEENNLEDLWRRCFVVSSNITKSEVLVHQTGLVWKSIRASISLPGIVPPVSTESGDLLIDGGIVNNLPVDIMRQFSNGGKVMAVNLAQKHQIHGYINPNGWLSGWSVLSKQLNPFKKIALDIPNIAEIIYESIVLCSTRHTRLMTAEADYTIEIDASDYKLFDFASMDELVEHGYASTMKLLSKG